MNDKNSKPTLAAGMAWKSMWMGAIGCLLGTFCRIEALGPRLQAVLGLLSTALLAIACIFGLVALIRITFSDWKVVLAPALCGVFLGIWFTISLAHWCGEEWRRARRQVAQRDESAAVARAQAILTAKPVSLVAYELPAFDQIPDVIPKIRADAAQHTGEDAAVLRAWAAHLERFYATYTNTITASNKLHEVDLLNPKLIADFNNNEVVRRRGLANQYYHAWHKVSEAVSTFSGSIYEDLRNEQVSPTRTGQEAQAMFAFVQRPEVAQHLASLRRFCEAEEAIGNRYNYAVDAVFQYARDLNHAPTLAPDSRKSMDAQILNLREVEKAVVEAFRQTSAKPGQKL